MGVIYKTDWCMHIYIVLEFLPKHAEYHNVIHSCQIMVKIHTINVPVTLYRAMLLITIFAKLFSRTSKYTKHSNSYSKKKTV